MMAHNHMPSKGLSLYPSESANFVRTDLSTEKKNNLRQTKFHFPLGARLARTLPMFWVLGFDWHFEEEIGQIWFIVNRSMLGQKRSIWNAGFSSSSPYLLSFCQKSLSDIISVFFYIFLIYSLALRYVFVVVEACFPYLFCCDLKQNSFGFLSSHKKLNKTSQRWLVCTRSVSWCLSKRFIEAISECLMLFKAPTWVL